eukprot:PhM_4_TR286/c0_g15_i1/m.80545/K18465/MRT43, SWIP; WASH complex subunit 7
MSAADNFVFDNFMDQPDKLPQDVALDRMRSLVSGYCSELCDAERHLSEDLADGELWDIHTDNVRVEISLERGPPSIESYLGCVVKDNKYLHRILLVLSSLQSEMATLQDEAREVLIPALALFGESSDISSAAKTSALASEELFFPRMMPVLMDLWNYRERCTEVVRNVVQQFACIYDEKNRKRGVLTPYLSVHFTPVWRGLGSLIATLVTMDEIIRQNDNFIKFSTIFKRMMRNARSQPDKFDTDEVRMKRFDALLNSISHDVLDDRLTEPILTAIYDDSGVNVHGNNVLHDEMRQNLRDLLKSSTQYLGTPVELDSRRQIMGVYSLCLLYFRIFQDRVKKDPESKKLFKELFDLHKVIPVVHLHGTYYWQLGQSLAQRLPILTNSICRDPTKENIHSLRSQCKVVEDRLESKHSMYVTQANIWMAQMQSVLRGHEKFAKDNVVRTSSLMYKGLALVEDMNTFVKTALGLFSIAKEGGVTPKKLSMLCQIVNIIMAMRETVHSRTSAIDNMYSVCAETAGFNLHKNIHVLRGKFLENQARFDDTQTDQLSALDLMTHILQQPYSRLGFDMLGIAMSVALQRAAPFSTEERFDAMRNDYDILTKVANMQHMFFEATNVSYLYWYRDLVFPIQFKTIFSNPIQASELPYVCMAAGDAIPLLHRARHGATNETFVEAYKTEMTQLLNDTLIQPLCREVENFLRLHIHSVILGQAYHVIESQPKDFARLLRVRDIRFLDEVVCIRDVVQHYLEQQFYNLTALHSQDWKTYEEMRALAKEIFDINMSESHLPGHVMDQGLDVLVITRRIGDFVTRYAYNMNSQMFIERPSGTDSRFVHTLQIRHISNSIRTHGTGIMNTTVNFVYQFLTRKLSLVSQFLFDDHVKSRLIKDARYFQEVRGSTNNCFPLPRAEKFCVDIRKLGLLEDGKSYLDQFRQLITEIGNVLGYVRMMRSGGLRSISEAAVFIPDIENVPQFERLLEGKRPIPKKAPRSHAGGEHSDEDEEHEEEEEDLGDDTAEPIAGPTSISAGHALDTVLNNLIRRLSDDSDFFKLIFSTFEDNINNEKNAHLKNFYMIVPSLTLSFVEHISSCKERLLKKGKDDVFTDDGFALGVVFLLTLIHNNADFDSLHWFPSVVKALHDERKSLVDLLERKAKEVKSGKKPVGGGADDTEIKTAPLTLNKIESHLKEFILLEATFRSARVFFKEKGKSVMDDNDADDDATA